MKNSHLIIAGLVLILAISSCTKKPEAFVEASKTTASADEAITVTSTSVDANVYHWHFYEGVKASVQVGSSTSHRTIISGGDICDNSVTFSFDAVGTYTVLLDACNMKGGCTATESSGYCDIATVTITIQ